MKAKRSRSWVAVDSPQIWHLTRRTLSHNKGANNHPPEKLLTECRAEILRSHVSQISALPPDDHLCLSCLHPDLRVPPDWALEIMPRQLEHALLSAPSRYYMATLDFQKRGIRSGCTTAGRFLGEEWNKPRKKYEGPGWKQALLDDAIDHLRGLLSQSTSRTSQ